MASPLLPDDAIFEILTRLPLQTLATSKLVSSSWNRITYEPAFTDLHPSRTKTAVGYFIQPRKYGIPTYLFTDGGPALSLSFLPKPVKITACDRGILLCVKEQRDKHPYVPEYYVCKPTTNEFTKIPNPKTRFTMEKIAIVVSGVSPLKYKIVRVSKYRDSGWARLPCEVYDSGLGAWKRLADIKLPYDHIFGGEKPVIVGDQVVWLSNESLFVFDSLNETWEILPVPEGSGSMRLTKHEGKLCLLQDDDDFGGVNVWTMQNNREWKKQNFKKVDGLGFPMAMRSADVAVFSDFNRMRFYNFATGSIKDVKADVFGSELFFFSSDYEPCNLVNSNS